MTSFDEEWAQIKQDVSGQMQLAGAGEDEWGDSSELASSRKAWTSAAEGVRGLRSSLRTAKSTLDTKTEGSGGAGSEGFWCSVSLGQLLTSWGDQLDLIGRECGEFAGKLEKAGSDHYANDEAVRDAFKEQLSKPQDSAYPQGRGPAQGG